MGGWPVCYLHSVEELNSGPPKTKPSSGREEDLNPGPPDYKSSALTLGHACLLPMSHFINLGSPIKPPKPPKNRTEVILLSFTAHYQLDWPGIVSGGIPLIWTFCLCMVGWRSSEGLWKAECATKTTVFLLSGQCLVMAWTSWWIWSTYT